MSCQDQRKPTQTALPSTAEGNVHIRRPRTLARPELSTILNPTCLTATERYLLGGCACSYPLSESSALNTSARRFLGAIRLTQFVKVFAYATSQ